MLTIITDFLLSPLGSGSLQCRRVDLLWMGIDEILRKGRCHMVSHFHFESIPYHLLCLTSSSEHVRICAEYVHLHLPGKR